MHAHIQYNLKYINNIQRKKDQTEISQVSRRLFSSFFDFENILIHVRKQKLLENARSHPLYIHCNQYVEFSVSRH